MIADRDLDFSGLTPPGSGLQDWAGYLRVAPILRDGALSCRGAGEQAAGRFIRRRRRTLSSHGLVFISAGRGHYLDGQHPEGIEVRAPAVIWLFPGVVHNYGPAPSGWREHWLLFEGISTRALEGMRAWSPQRPVAAAGADLGPQVGPAFDRLRTVLEVPDDRAALLAATITHQLIGVAAQATSVPRAPAESLVQVMIGSAFVDLPVAERARRAGLGEDALRHRLRAATGLSPHEFIIQVRLSRAQRLLARTQMPIAAVAREVGYDDAAYFSRLFTRRVGSSPLGFRRQEAR